MSSAKRDSGEQKARKARQSPSTMQFAADAFLAVSMEDMFRRVAANGAEAVNGSMCTVFHKLGDKLNLKATFGLEGVDLPTTGIRLGTSISGRVIQRGEPLMLESASQYGHSIKDNLEVYFTGPLICVPIKFNDFEIGLINAGRRDGAKPFSALDLHRLIRYANLVSFLIAGQRIVEQRTEELGHQLRVLRENEKKLRMVFDRAMNPILGADENGRFIEANQAALDFLETRNERLLGKTLWDLCPPDQLEAQRTEHADWLKPRSVETPFFVGRKVKTLLLNLMPLAVSGKTILYGIGQDVTEQKRARDALEASNRFLEITNATADLPGLLDAYASTLVDLVHCEAVGLTIYEEGRPTSASPGFPERASRNLPRFPFPLQDDRRPWQNNRTPVRPHPAAWQNNRTRVRPHPAAGSGRPPFSPTVYPTF